MSDWRSWRLQQWNERLLMHFFGRRLEDELPVVALLATPEELARATGDRSADATEVRADFVGQVRAAIARSGSLFDDASNYQDWPKPPAADRIPRFVSHLIFTCIAASESSEELASEGSYLQRLRELAGGMVPDHSLQWLPTLWENLAAWLKMNAEGYRPLKLPDPGGYTRIGYTVKLTFPDRRDQRTLSELLGREGLLGHDPPVGKVIALVATARGQFRRPFIEAFDDFRQCLARGSAHAKDLVEHRFWSAVRDASLRGRGAADEEAGPEGSARFQLLCEEDDDKLHPFLVTDEPLASGSGLSAMELPVPFDIWRYAVIRNEQGNKHPEAAYSTARSVLQGGLAIPRLSSLSVQGLLPLVEGVHGYLELAGPDQLEESRAALARRELSEALIDTFGKGRARSRTSVIEGWLEVRGLQLRRLPSETLEHTALGSCWQLYESIARNSVRLQGGVRADDSWLGYREVLPRIIAANAQEVRIRRPDGTSEPLHADDDGAWRLPPQDHEGEYYVEAAMDGSVERVSARFNRVVGTESFRMPDELDAWIVEGVGGTGTLSMLAPLSSLLGNGVAPVADRTAYLGPIVGQFVGCADEAAWRVTRFAGKTRGARCRHDLAEETGTARIADGSGRRKWRQLLLNCGADPADEGFDAARSRIRQRVVGQLPIVDAVSRAVTLDLARKSSVAPEVERLLSIAAARAGGRTGIAYGEWSRHVERVLGVPRERVRAITRSWAEAGLLDIAFYARWTHCSVFARAPQLVVFRTEHDFAATIMGMLLPTTRGSVVAAAKQAGIFIEERCGVSALAPSLITMRCSRLEQLNDLSKLAGLPLSWLDLDLAHYAVQCRHDGRDAPPQNYDERVSWRHWSLGPIEDRAGISFERCARHGRPDYWRVASQGRSAWSYDLNTARLWAAAMLGEKALAVSAETGLTAVHGYLPLPLARFVSVVEGTAPGMDQSGQYHYRMSTPELSKRVMNVVESIFDARRLAAPAQAMMG